MNVAFERTKTRISVNRYQMMVAAGVLTRDDRIELIEGEMIVDVEGKRIFVHREAAANSYMRTLEFTRSDSVSPIALPAVHLTVQTLFAQVNVAPRHATGQLRTSSR